MKLNIAFPTTGAQKVVEVDDENKLRAFYDKRMSQEVEGDILGDEFKGYVFRITGGNDKQGFPMKQGVMTPQRVRLLVSEGHTCYRTRRPGERKRKSVRGCVVSSELSVLNLVVVHQGKGEIDGLTNVRKPRRHGPKRASNIRKLFNLTKKDDVRTYVIKRRIAKEGQKAYLKYPKIQRLITPQRLQRKRHMFSVATARIAATKKAAETYNALLASRYKEARDKRQALVQKRRSASTRKSEKGAAGGQQQAAASGTKPATTTTTTKPATTAATTTNTTKPKKDKKDKKKKEVATKPAAAAPAAGAKK